MHPPALPLGADRPEIRWLTELFSTCAHHRVELTADPETAEVVLVTDLQEALSYSDGGDPSRVLSHPVIREQRRKCFVYSEDDVPRPILPGLYAALEWYPGYRRRTAVLPYGSWLKTYENRALVDDPPPAEREWLFSFVAPAGRSVRGGGASARCVSSRRCVWGSHRSF